MASHRTDWHQLNVRLFSGAHAPALGWSTGEEWVLDREIDGEVVCCPGDVTDLGPLEVSLKPEPSGPVAQDADGWWRASDKLAGYRNLTQAEEGAEYYAQQLANALAISAHLRARALTSPVVEDVEVAVRQRHDVRATRKDKKGGKAITAVDGSPLEVVDFATSVHIIRDCGTGKETTVPGEDCFITLETAREAKVWLTDYMAGGVGRRDEDRVQVSRALAVRCATTPAAQLLAAAKRAEKRAGKRL